MRAIVRWLNGENPNGAARALQAVALCLAVALSLALVGHPFGGATVDPLASWTFLVALAAIVVREVRAAERRPPH